MRGRNMTTYLLAESCSSSLVQAPYLYSREFISNAFWIMQINDLPVQVATR